MFLNELPYQAAAPRLESIANQPGYSRQADGRWPRPNAAIQRSVLAGRYPAWDFQPFEDATRLYYRGDGGDWHAAEQRDFLRFG